MEEKKKDDEWTKEEFNKLQTNGLSDQWALAAMGFRTNGLSDKWAFGLMGFRTNGLFFGLMGFRNNELSD